MRAMVGWRREEKGRGSHLIPALRKDTQKQAKATI